jgi:hypothetical protein
MDLSILLPKIKPDALEALLTIISKQYVRHLRLKPRSFPKTLKAKAKVFSKDT